jgi:abequosyltransferase
MCDVMSAPRISVCIPAYNRAALLPVLLDSVFAQDFSDFEVVIAEDKSPEREAIAAVACDYVQRYPGQVVYEENVENCGYDGNLRRLIELARGDYVLFMGNDDLMAPGALAAVAEATHAYPQVGVLLRSYASFNTTPDKLVQTFRYFDKDAFFPVGPATITTFFRRCVFISGMVVRRESALALSTDRFDGTLLYQQHLVGGILARENGVYLTQILSYHRLGGAPDFGNSPVEKGLFVPREQTAESSVHFMRGMLSIAKAVERDTYLQVYRPILRDIGNYAYPILSIQAQRSRSKFLAYAYALAKLGFWRVPLFHAYALGLLILGRNTCDCLIALIKRWLGRAPKIWRVYWGQE